jgi:hypothetical protein
VLVAGASGESHSMPMCGRRRAGPDPSIAAHTALCHAQVGPSYRVPRRVSAYPHKGDRGRKWWTERSVSAAVTRGRDDDARSWVEGFLPAATSRLEAVDVRRTLVIVAAAFLLVWGTTAAAGSAVGAKTSTSHEGNVEKLLCNEGSPICA